MNRPIGKSRAYEVIAIADGRKTVEEVREATAERTRQTRERQSEEQHVSYVAETQTEKPNENNDPVKEARAYRDHCSVETQPEKPNKNNEPTKVDPVKEARAKPNVRCATEVQPEKSNENNDPVKEPEWVVWGWFGER